MDKAWLMYSMYTISVTMCAFLWFFQKKKKHLLKNQGFAKTFIMLQ